MLRIVLDGAGDMPPGWAEQYALDVIPINIQFGEQTFLQGIDLSDADFYRIARENGVIPQTSQPSPQQFVDFYRRIAQPGDTILSIHVTRKLSGTYESAEIAAHELRSEFTVLPFDSAAGSAAMGYMGKEARELDRAGAPTAAILERLQFIRRNIIIVLTLDTLEFARKSGRVKALQAALASVLNVKAIVALEDGVLDMADRVRTRRRALEATVEHVRRQVGDRPVNAAVVHALDPESAEILAGLTQAALDCRQLVITDLSISVAANLGPGTVGVVAYPVDE